MKRVLCYGDSNTWGTVPGESRRYTEHERWPALLDSRLPDTVTVIEEGQQGRTLVHNPPFAGDKNGQRYLKHCLAQYTPELVLILLGTNDLKKRFSLSAVQVAQSAVQLANQAQSFTACLGKPAKVLLIAPPPIYEVGTYAQMYAGAAAKSQQLAAYYAQYASEAKVTFFDAGAVVSSCPVEGIHWQSAQHYRLADALVPLVRELLVCSK